jgi:NAD(P)-dependent dehydrogenase (short-subunit alcohol dehydrogenase family)
MNSPIGKHVLVTGASRGIGLAAAEAFAAAGCDVAINSFGDAPRLDASAKNLADAFGVRTFALEADVADAAAARAMTRRAADLLGGLDIVVCNAGICDFRPFLELTDADWKRHVGINFDGAFFVSHEAAKIMVEQGRGGRIIFTTSVGAVRSNPTQTHYCATKGGLHVLMQGMALELGRLGINVNAVAPGWIHTEINHEASTTPEIANPFLQGRCALGRFGDPEDLKGAYLFLGSKEGAYVNGSTVTVDGGWLAQL